MELMGEKFLSSMLIALLSLLFGYLPQLLAKKYSQLVKTIFTQTDLRQIQDPLWPAPAVPGAPPRRGCSAHQLPLPLASRGPGGTRHGPHVDITT